MHRLKSLNICFFHEKCVADSLACNILLFLHIFGAKNTYHFVSFVCLIVKDLDSVAFKSNLNKQKTKLPENMKGKKELEDMEDDNEVRCNADIPK